MQIKLSSNNFKIVKFRNIDSFLMIIKMRLFVRNTEIIIIYLYTVFIESKTSRYLLHCVLSLTIKLEWEYKYINF